MSFTSAHYLLFLPVVLFLYFAFRGGFRKIVLFAANNWFYFYAAPRYFAVSLLARWVVLFLSHYIDMCEDAKIRRRRLAFSVCLLLAFLCFFKYNNFFAAFLSPIFARFGIVYEADFFVASSFLGISFFTFNAIGYLTDLARKDIGRLSQEHAQEGEKYPLSMEFINLDLFLGFFPMVSMGPICRAGSLMPQINDTTRRFDAQGVARALLLMGIGFFKKLAVADTIGVFTDHVYQNIAKYSGLTLSLAALAFALQLYFDFSGYSDIARGSAQLFGIKLPQNFNIPYLSTNFSAFWSRWHMSLSSWLQDYVFTPLVWSRWTAKFSRKSDVKPPVLSSLAITFLLSGLWHGEGWCFVVWGALQALFRIGEELAHRHIGKPKKNPGFWQRLGKTALVFCLWTESLVFFRVGMGKGTVGQAVAALGRQFAFTSPAQLWQDVFSAAKGGFYADGRIAAAFLLFSAICTALAIGAECWQWRTAPEGSLANSIAGQAAPRRWLIYYTICLCSFAGFLAQSGGFGGSSFLYRGF